MENLMNEILNSKEQLFYYLFVIVLTFQIVGFTPLSKDDLKTDKKAKVTGSAMFLVFFRRVLLSALVLDIFIICGPLLFAWYRFGSIPEWLRSEYWGFVANNVLLFFAGIGAVYFAKLIWYRYFIPYLSQQRKKLRVQQTHENLSDITQTTGSIKPKEFEVEKYYKEGFLFMGLDGEDNPVYLPWEEWKSWNQKYVGESQVGKGVAIGVILDQVIKHYQAVFVDPKPDKHAFAIMKRRAEIEGKKFLVLDLNIKGEHLYDPLQHGTFREKRTKLHYLAGLNDDGGSADYYKAGERSELDDIFQELDSREEETGFAELREQVSMTGEDYLTRTKSYLKELSYLESIPGPEERHASVNIKEEIKQGTIIYVKSHIKDELVKKVSMLLVMEVVDALMSLYEEGERRNPEDFCHVNLDEVKFLVSREVSDNLATIAGFNANMGLSFQSLSDLEGLQSDAEIAKSIKINTKYSIFYQGKDSDTIDYVAKLSGTTLKDVTRMEEVKENRFGGEEWDDSRKIGKEKEALLNENILLSLPQRVGAMFAPGKIAQLLYTYWIPVDLDQWGYVKKDNKYKPPAVKVEQPPEPQHKPKPKKEKKIEPGKGQADGNEEPPKDKVNNVEEWGDDEDLFKDKKVESPEEKKDSDYADYIVDLDDLT